MGGDTNATPNYSHAISRDESLQKLNPGLVINITLLGEVRPKNIITRQGARPGDCILLTGQVGDSAAGLDLLRYRKNLPVDEYPEDFTAHQQAVNRHLVPIVRLAESQIISQNHLATAMIDVSDGVAGDLRHICYQSNVGATLWCEQIPVSKASQDIARLFRKSHLSYGLAGGEDYELLFTCSPDRVDEAKRLIKRGTGTSVSIIGKITLKEEGVRFIDSRGQDVAVPATGFDHFQKGGF